MLRAVATGAGSFTGILAPSHGGTGIANADASTITLGGALTLSGAFATTFTVTGVTGVTLPTTGTLATLAGSEALSNKTISASSATLTTLTSSTADGTTLAARVFIGDSSRTAMAGQTGLSLLVGTDTAAGAVAQFRKSNNGTNAPSFAIGKSRGTQAVPLVIVTGDVLGNMNFSGFDGTNYTQGAAIVITSEGTIAAAQVPANMAFQTATAAGTLTTALSINSSQTVAIAKGLVLATRVITAAGAITVAVTDYTMVVNKTVGAASAVALPAGVLGQTFIIKDGKGDANSNNITITPAAGTVDGAATLVMTANYQSVTLTYNGTEWNAI